MTTALVSHLVRQGIYAKADIAVITPYLGQLQRLRRRMESMFEICLNERDLEEIEALEGDSNAAYGSPRSQLGKTTLLESLRIATVDNFQGEEATVVIISLVRSNLHNSCGFLRTPNRINVLLSRAQHGMYIIGNANTYGHISMWADVIRNLRTAGNLGTSLELQCPRHPNAPLAVSQPDRFAQFSPESGCILPCERRLNCGHSCRGRCHSSMLHDAVKCQEKCPRRKKGCDHACPLRCGDACHDKCQIFLKDIDLILPCGHRIFSAKCWEARDPATIRCVTRVTRTVPGCGHQTTVACHQDVTGGGFICGEKCGHLRRACGHGCARPCWHCNTRQAGKVTKTEHGVCTVVCGRNFTTYRHVCSSACHGSEPCPPCAQPCDNRCSHSACSKACHEPCSPCAEQKCSSSCEHTQCTMPCAAPCDWVPCSKRCDKTLSCSHQCKLTSLAF